jgi:hypothetical protein
MHHMEMVQCTNQELQEQLSDMRRLHELCHN